MYTVQSAKIILVHPKCKIILVLSNWWIFQYLHYFILLYGLLLLLMFFAWILVLVLCFFSFLLYKVRSSNYRIGNSCCSKIKAIAKSFYFLLLSHLSDNYIGNWEQYRKTNFKSMYATNKEIFCIRMHQYYFRRL